MPTGIVKLGDLYVYWSTVVDAPTSGPMTKDELRTSLLEEGEWAAPPRTKPFDRWYYERQVDSRIARTDKNGTSFYGYESAEEFVAFNRAGPRETCLSYKKLVEWAHNEHL